MRNIDKIGPISMLEIEAKDLRVGDFIMMDESVEPWNRHRFVLVTKTYAAGANKEFQITDIDGCGTKDPDDPDPLQGRTYNATDKLYILRAEG